MRRAPLLLSVLCLFLAVVPDLFSGEKELTLQRIHSLPPLDGVLTGEWTWLPRGERCSWLASNWTSDQETKRLVVARPSSGSIDTVFSEADTFKVREGEPPISLSLDDYRWTPREDGLLLTAGNDLYLVELPQRKVRRLTTDGAKKGDPQFSPDGRLLAYTRGGNLFVLDLSSGREAALTADGGPDRLNGQFDWLYQEEIYSSAAHAFSWSADSRSIAFLAFDLTEVPRFPLTDYKPIHPATELQPYSKAGDPNPAARLFVVTLGTDLTLQQKVVQHLSSSEGYLARFGWAPDGQVWYQLLSRPQTRLELRKFDPATGQSQLLLVETDPAWVNLHDDLRFLPDGRFLWTSEKDEFRHIYLHDPLGRPIRQLTRGAWTVAGIAGLELEAGSVYFHGNSTTALESHLFRVSLDGGEPQRVTREAGCHRVEWSPAGGFGLDTFSTIRRPPGVWLVDRDGRRVMALDPNEHPEWEQYRLGNWEFVELNHSDGTRLHAALLRPPGFDPAQRYPVVVYVYGGPHVQLVRNSWGGRYFVFHQFLASRGFLVFVLDNRGSAGRGREFERAIQGRLGPKELEDQLAGVAWLKRQPFVDPGRIGIFGASYGGFMTLYALTHTQGVFKAGAALAPVTDWRLYDTAYTERYMQIPASNPDGYREASPISRPEQLDGALLLIHGTTDNNVHWQQTLNWIDALYKAGKPYDLQLYPNKSHRIDGKAARLHLFAKIVDHFTRALGR